MAQGTSYFASAHGPDAVRDLSRLQPEGPAPPELLVPQFDRASFFWPNDPNQKKKEKYLLLAITNNFYYEQILNYKQNTIKKALIFTICFIYSSKYFNGDFKIHSNIQLKQIL